MPRLLIGDGFDFSFTSKPTDRTPDPVTIQFRPPTQLALAKLDQALLGSPEQVAVGKAEFLTEHIGSWNVDDGDGKPVPVTKEVFQKIRDWNLIGQLIAEIQRSNTKAADEQKK